MAETTTKFIRAVAALLDYHRGLGIENYPAGDDLQRFLARPLPIPTPVVLPPPPADESASSPSKLASPVKRPTVGRLPDLVGCQELSIEVGRCRACPLAAQRVRPVPGHGGSKVRLMVVGDWLHLAADGIGGADSVFGGEEDAMLARMLTAIGLTGDEVFVTNVIKCGLAKDCQPAAEHIRVCLSFLQRQIVLIQPQIVLAMGMVATKALLDRPESLSQLRGKILDFAASDGKAIPLIATFHPSYLLQNPEMKKATWADLQILAKWLNPPIK